MNNFGVLPLSQVIENLQVLGSWGANLLRWQVVGDMTQISSWDAATYQRWLEGQIAQIQAIIPTCESLGLNIIVDMHSPVGGITTLNDTTTETIFVEDWAADAFVENWTLIAQSFAGNPIVLGYDLLNEPITRSGGAWNALAPKAAHAASALDSSKTIIVECIGSTPQGMHTLKPIAGVPLIWYSFHLYVPNSITFQGLPDAHGNIIPIGAPYPSAKVDKETIIKALNDAFTFEKTYGGQLYVGEYSCSRWSSYPGSPNAFNYLTDCISIFEEYGWHWTYHAFREASAWELEYNTTPCPDLSNPNCTQPYQVTDRVELMKTAFARNSSSK